MTLPSPVVILSFVVAATCATNGDLTARTALAADAPIVVRNGKQIAATTIACRRYSLGQPEDYKPSIVQLPSGELLLVVF